MTIPDIKNIFPEELPENISFLTLLDQFHEGVIITDASGNILYMNTLQEEMAQHYQLALDVIHKVGPGGPAGRKSDSGTGPDAGRMGITRRSA